MSAPKKSTPKRGPGRPAGSKNWGVAKARAGRPAGAWKQIKGFKPGKKFAAEGREMRTLAQDIARGYAHFWSSRRGGAA